MGIPHLAPYVDTLPRGEGQVWELYKLQDTNLIIDGCGLYYYIYISNKMNVKHGGQYKQLQNKVKEFISNLQSNNVVPYVVFDGIMEKDDKKFDTRFRRRTENITRMKNLWMAWKPNGNEMVLPRLAELTVIHVLQEMKVQYAVADFEADCEIASLANKLDAPVMAKDSDFFIFNIKCGYIPFQHYSFSGPDNTVEKFNFNGFARYLGIGTSMLPLLASLAGNDYVTYAMLKPFNSHIQKLLSTSELVGGSKKCKVPTIAQFLSTHNSVSGAIQAVKTLFTDSEVDTFEKALRLSIEEYQAKQSNLIGYFDSCDLHSNIHTYNGNVLPNWMVKLYREGLIASEGLSCLCNRKLFLRVQCEDVSLESAQTCVKYLRSWYYYQLTFNCENYSTVVPSTEVPSQSWDQSMPNIVNDQTASQIKVTNHDTRPSTSQIKSNNNTTLELEFASKLKFNHDVIVIELDRSGSTLAERKINLSSLQIQIYDIPKLSDESKKSLLQSLFHSELSFVNDLPIKHQLVVSALIYWVCNCEVTPAQLAALLVHYIGEKRAPVMRKPLRVSIKEFHGFSQWQNVVYWTERLNTLFSSVFPRMLFAKMYDGFHICSLYDRLRDAGINMAETIVVNANLYRHLYDVITRAQPPDCLINQPRSSQKQRDKESIKSEGDKQTQKKSSENLKGNRFALLCSSDSDED